MALRTIAIFLLAYATAVAVPSPGLAALIARVLARGPRGISPFVAGFIVGDLIYFVIAVAGMAALANTLGPLFTVFLFCWFRHETGDTVYRTHMHSKRPALSCFLNQLYFINRH